MNLNEITNQGFILALFIRDDSQRFLLGSGAYEFKEDQLHFSANSMTNDIVEVQGNDGCMLAGQVRRPTTQVFDGYIGDASVNRAEVENYRRDFFAFFQKNHFYTVIYIFPNGSAIQRRRGFIVDCGEVKELYQLFPEYHIGMNFEDVNYYKYNEDSDGHEIYGKSAIVGLSTDMTGGLVWEDMVVDTQTKTGVNITFNGSFADEFVGLKMYGDTTQQTYTGKNKFQAPSSPLSVWQLSYAKDSDNSFTLTTDAGASGASYVEIDLSSLPKSAEITISFVSNRGTVPIRQKVNGTWGNVIVSDGSGYTFTTGSSSTSIAFYTIYGDYSEQSVSITNVQIETGSQATTYEPYVGGTYSPNPDYPQEVNVVSGTQTITVSDGGSQSETYTLDLGSIELCKIGTYQDYIYKSGDDWYIHKETGFLTLDTSKIQSAYGLKYRYAKSDIPNCYIPINSSNFLCKYFTVVNNSSGAIGTVYAGGSMINFRYDEDGSDLNGFKTWAGSVGLSLYYVLANPTDTQITDSTLIGQLDAVVSGGSYNGNTIISVSGDLASPLEVQAKCGSGGGVEWDSDGAVWEDGGGGGATTVSVDSIENVYPVWKVVGPTNNPTLENITTGTTISYAGNVANGQTLVVDMLNETAKLNGTSVIGDISGKWLEFAPGNNRINYTATNSTAPDSTIEWQEIVG